MRIACLVWLIAGCGFTSQEGPVDPADDDGAGGAPGGGSGGSGATASQCDVTDASLRLCLTFDTPTVQDLVEPPHVLADNTGIQILQILANATAKLDGRSHIRFMPSGDFDAPELTLDLLIDPGKLMKDQNSATLIDHDQHYFAAYQDDGHIQCGIGDKEVTSEATVSGGWHHIACRYEAARHELRVYIDGSVSGCTDVSGGIPAGGPGELAIGASYNASTYQNSYVGSLDSRHVYGRALSDAELCSAAQKTACTTRCPDQGGPRGPQ
jgi:hypothetical protein